MKKYSALLLTLLALSLSGCVTGSRLITGQARPPIAVHLVQVYTSMPDGAEVIGIVTANSTASTSWDTAKLQCTEKLREKAAEVGANGIVITAVNDSIWEGQNMSAKAVYLTPKK